MKFTTKITLINVFYNFLKKISIRKIFDKNFNLEDYFDTYLDDHYPSTASKLQTFISQEKIAICSTNGKKITANMVMEIFKKMKKTYITNIVDDKDVSKTGSIYLAFINDILRSYKIFKKEIKRDCAVMAINEEYLGDYFNLMKFDYLLLNNLFIDQKDGLNLEQKRKCIKDALKLNSDINLIINADEPYFHTIDEVEKNMLSDSKIKKIYFGFEKIRFINERLSQKNDLRICPKCNCPLDWNEVFYSHIGKYNCDCNFKRPMLDVSANAEIYKNYCFLDVKYKGENYIYKIPFGGIENAYNALGVIALAYCFKIERSLIASALESYKGTKGSDERIKDNKIHLKKIKNPTSLSLALEELFKNRHTKVVFALSDEKEDGIDTSWIFDSNFSVLQNFENKVYVTSKRFDDMALRLKYAGVNPCLITMEQNIKSALTCCYFELRESENMLVLATPSNMKEIVEVLKNNNL